MFGDHGVIFVSRVVAKLEREVQPLSSSPIAHEHTELKYAVYPAGGFYQRHTDNVQVGRVVRDWSFVLYLNEDWCV